MAYTIVPTVETGNLWTAAQHNAYLRDNFAAGVPDIFTAKGGLAVGTGVDAAEELAVGINTQLLAAKASTATGHEYNYSAVQIGMIIVWYGAIVNIPTGWQICDGTNGTPDLRNKFVIGAGSTYAVGAMGGALTHDHSQANVGAEATHTHTQGVTGGEATHTHDASGSAIANDGYFGATGPDVQHVSLTTHIHSLSATSGAGSNHIHNNPTSAAGSSHDHTNPNLDTGTNTPLFKALVYIQRIS